MKHGVVTPHWSYNPFAKVSVLIRQELTDDIDSKTIKWGCSFQSKSSLSRKFCAPSVEILRFHVPIWSKHGVVTPHSDRLFNENLRLTKMQFCAWNCYPSFVVVVNVVVCDDSFSLQFQENIM